MGGANTEHQSQVAGIVEDVLPNALYRVKLDGGRNVTAGLTNSLRQQVVRIIVGDRVEVKLATYDPNRGHIVEKL